MIVYSQLSITFPYSLTEQFFPSFTQTVINKILEENNIEANYDDYKIQHNHLYSPRYRLKVQEKLADTMIINLQIFLRSEPENIFQQWKRFLRFLILGFYKLQNHFYLRLKQLNRQMLKNRKRFLFSRN